MVNKVVMASAAARYARHVIVGFCSIAYLFFGAQLARAETHFHGSDNRHPDLNSLHMQTSIPANDCAEPDQSILSAIVPVATDHGSHASGIVYQNNRVLTAAHALRGGGRFFVRVDKEYLPANLHMVDHQHDLAVLIVDTAQIKPQRFSDLNDFDAGMVWAAGYPRARAMAISVGNLQGLYDRLLHTSATIDSGQSGGGLLSCVAGTWSLVGMLRGFGAYLAGGEYVKLENHSVSVSSSTIIEFLHSN